MVRDPNRPLRRSLVVTFVRKTSLVLRLKATRKPAGGGCLSLKSVHNGKEIYHQSSLKYQNRWSQCEFDKSIGIVGGED